MQRFCDNHSQLRKTLIHFGALRKQFVGMNRRFPKDKKGFSLTELIVVLVIILLLVILLLPPLLDKIEFAKMNAEIAETRSAAVALQTVLTMAYDDAKTDEMLDKTDIYNVRPTKACRSEMRDLTHIELGKVTHIKVGSMNNVIGFVYESLRGSVVIYDKGVYTVSDLH